MTAARGSPCPLMPSLLPAAWHRVPRPHLPRRRGDTQSDVSGGLGIHWEARGQEGADSSCPAFIPAVLFFWHVPPGIHLQHHICRQVAPGPLGLPTTRAQTVSLGLFFTCEKRKRAKDFYFQLSGTTGAYQALLGLEAFPVPFSENRNFDSGPRMLSEACFCCLG